MTHLFVIEKTLFNRVGQLRQGYEGAQDWDLALRATEKTIKIGHIPKILYHWRMSEQSTAKHGSKVKKYAYVAQKSALESALERRGVNAIVEEGKFDGSYRIKKTIDNNQTVSIIIPTKDNYQMLKKCIDSITKNNTYINLDITIVSNNTKNSKAIKLLDQLSENKNIQILDYPHKFNYSTINNFAVKKVAGDYILFLNDDIEIITKGFIENMLEWAQFKEIGSVGAKLYYPNKTIQHAGVIMGIGYVAGHSHRHFPDYHPGHGGYLNVIRNYSAVTGACLMLSKEKFNLIHGFDEKNLPVAYNDVDLCLRLLEKGFRNIFTPFVEAVHHESVSRGNSNNDGGWEKDIKEIKYMQKRWANYINYDPYYNPNLTKQNEDFNFILYK